MSLSGSSLKAINLLNKGQVIFVSATFRLFHFKINSEQVNVCYDRQKDYWTCYDKECKHPGFRGNKENTCYHIKAARFYLLRKEEKL